MLPIFRAAGAKSAGTTTAVTVAAPAGIAVGDLEILIATTIAGGTVTINDNGGSSWTAITGSPIDVTSGQKLYVWWRKRQTGDGSPQVTAATDHVCAARLAYQANTYDLTTPIEIEAASTETTSDTSFSWAPGTSTTVNNCLVLVISSILRDSNTASVPVCTNASLSSLASRANYCTNNGGGGGFGVTEGALATAGAIGTFACTYGAASPKSFISFAIRAGSDLRRAVVTWAQSEIPLGSYLDTDANGTVTESATASVPASGTDANGTITEATALGTAITSTDANSTTTESGSHSGSSTSVVQVTWIQAEIPDDGPWVVTDTDSSVTETTAQTAAITDTSTNGSTTESASAVISGILGTDDVSGAEGTTTELAVITAEADTNSTTTEDTTATVVLTATADTASVSEDQSISGDNFLGTDENAGLDELVELTAVLSDEDTGSDSENEIIGLPPLVDSDAGSSSAVGLVVARITTGDTNSAITENANRAGATPRAAKITWVQATLPTGNWILTSSDIGTASESASASEYVAPLTDTDSGAIAEDISLTVSIVPNPIIQSRKASAGLVFLFGDGKNVFINDLLDKGVISESASAANKFGADTNSAVAEVATVKAVVDDSDSGVISEALRVRFFDSDGSSTISEISVLISAYVVTDVNQLGEVASAGSLTPINDTDFNAAVDETVSRALSDQDDGGLDSEAETAGLRSLDTGVVTETWHIALYAQDENSFVAELGSTGEYTQVESWDVIYSTDVADCAAVIVESDTSTTDDEITLTYSVIASDASSATVEEIPYFSQTVLEIVATEDSAAITQASTTDEDLAYSSDFASLGFPVLTLDSSTGGDSEALRASCTLTDGLTAVELGQVLHLAMTGTDTGRGLELQFVLRPGSIQAGAKRMIYSAREERPVLGGVIIRG